MRVCEHDLACHRNRGDIRPRAVADSSRCSDWPQRSGLWFPLDVTSRWHCVRVISIILPSFPACRFVCADVVLDLLVFFVFRAKWHARMNVILAVSINFVFIYDIWYGRGT